MNKHLVLLDFDGTIANTFQDSPNGKNVLNASRDAIGVVFGREGVLAFDESGGLRNREPGELVKDISEMIRAAGVDISSATELFVRAKLDQLMPEVSPEWPRLYPGVADLFLRVNAREIPVDLAILSSGHDEAINRVMEVNDVPMDNVILVTSDVIRSRPMPDRPRYKPHSYQLAEAHRQWLRNSGVGPIRQEYDGFMDGRNYGKPRMMYIGDDPIKDGGLAREARIPFMFVPFTKDTYLDSPGVLNIRGIDQVAEILRVSELGLRSGKSFSQIIFGIDDRELFGETSGSERLYDRIAAESVRRIQERK